MDSTAEFEPVSRPTDAERAAEAVAALVFENYKEWLCGERPDFTAHFPIGLYKTDDDVQTIAHERFLEATGGVFGDDEYAVEVAPGKKIYRHTLVGEDRIPFHVAYVSDESLIDF